MSSDNNQFEALYKLTKRIEESRIARGGDITDDEAIELYEACNGIPLEDLRKNGVTGIQDFIDHENEDGEFDPKVTNLWPSSIIKCLREGRKTYDFSFHDSVWKIFATALTGEREHQADCHTESKADFICNGLEEGWLAYTPKAFSKSITVDVFCHDNDMMGEGPEGLAVTIDYELAERIKQLSSLVRSAGVNHIYTEYSQTDLLWLNEISEGDNGTRCEMKEEDFFDTRVDYEMIHVGATEFWFTGLPKHWPDGCKLETKAIPISVLDNAKYHHQS